MPLDDATQGAVRALWEVATRRGRTPEPVPEADPWEDDDPLDPVRGHVAVVVPGVPSVVVQLHRDGHDLVLVEDVVELDVPRRDTATVVDAVLAGRARRRIRGGALSRVLGMLLHNPLPADLEVTVPSGGRERTYTAPVVLTPGAGGWLASLPTVDDAPPADGRPGPQGRPDGGTGPRAGRG